MMTDKELEQLKHDICPCCLLDPKITPYGICDHITLLGELGSGYVAFFTLFKLCIGLSFIFILGNIHKIIANFNGNFCFDTQDPSYQTFKTLAYVCSRDWITVHSIANVGYIIDYEDKGLIIGCFAIFLVILVFFFPYFRNLGEIIDKRSDMPSDWTVQVEECN